MMQSVRGVLRQRKRKRFDIKTTLDAIRAGCAEAKIAREDGIDNLAVMQSVRGVPKQTEGHCIQTIMRRTMK